MPYWSYTSLIDINVIITIAANDNVGFSDVYVYRADIVGDNRVLNGKQLCEAHDEKQDDAIRTRKGNARILRLFSNKGKCQKKKKKEVGM